MVPLKILFYDLETSPRLYAAWGAKTRYLPHTNLIRDSHLLTWAAKWRGKNYTAGDKLTGHEARAGEDERIVRSLYEMIAEADFLVAHNIERFDWPRINGRLLLFGLDPIPPARLLDTKRWADQFGLGYSNLDFVAEKLGLGNKIKTEFEWWLEATFEGREDTLRKMLKYNRQDVRLLEGVFERFLPYARGVPRLMVAEHADEYGCVFCGSKNLQRRGYRHTNAASYVRLQCQDCRRYSTRPRHELSKRPALRPA